MFVFLFSDFYNGSDDVPFFCLAGLFIEGQSFFVYIKNYEFRALRIFGRRRFCAGPRMSGQTAPAR